MKLLKLGLCIPIICAIIAAMELVLIRVMPGHFVFKPATLQRIVNDALMSLELAPPAQAVMDRVYEGLKKEYGDYVTQPRSDEWVFNNAGNAMGSMVILHASLTEYLIFFGTSVGTEGHTGTHFADDYFTILHGEQHATLPNATKPEVYLPGEQHHLPHGVNKQYRMPPGSYALELAQGYIPTMLPFGFIEVFTSTFDVGTLYKTVYLTGREIIRSLLMGKI